MNRKKLKAVVDTNLFISGFIVPKGNPHALLKAIQTNKFTLLLSTDLLTELETVLERPKYRTHYRMTLQDIAVFLHDVKIGSKRIVPLYRLSVAIRDRKDEMVLTAALGGKADYLVTGDKDVLVVKTDPNLKSLKIVTVGEFIKILGGKK